MIRKECHNIHSNNILRFRLEGEFSAEQYLPLNLSV